jgi:hypothetical protein
MADIITAIVETTTNEFSVSGADLDATHIRVTVPRNPDPLREKWDGTQIVAKTAPEVTATLDAAKDAEGAQAFDTAKALKAVAISNLARALGKNPGALTPAEISAERTRIIAIYKGLP